MRKRDAIVVGSNVVWWIKVHPELPHKAGLDVKVVAIDGEIATISVLKDVTAFAQLLELKVPLSELESEAWVRDEEASAKYERSRFEKAAIVSNCDGLIEPDGEKVYESVDEYLEDCEDYEREPLPYLWCVNFDPINRMEQCDFVDHIAEQIGDENVDGLKGLPELQKAIDAFYEANSPFYVYNTDYSRAVMVNADS